MSIRVDRRGSRCLLSDAEAADFRASFAERPWAVLPGFFDTALLADLDALVREATLAEVTHTVGHELHVESDRVDGFLEFIANDATLLELVARLTGCGPIGCFSGRVYEMRAGAQHELTWHSDVCDDRLIALSVNLGTAPYAGGLLQIANAASTNVLTTISNQGRGDAILFRIAPELVHRVTPVESPSPRVAFAGWFRGKPSYRDVLAKLFSRARGG